MTSGGRVRRRDRGLGAGGGAGKVSGRGAEYRMAVKGLFQSDPHDARIIKGSPRPRRLDPRMIISGTGRPWRSTQDQRQQRIQDGLYGRYGRSGRRATRGRSMRSPRAKRRSRSGRRRHLPLRDELFNSPSTADYKDFARQLKELTGRIHPRAARRDRAEHHRGRAPDQRPPRIDREGRHPPDRWFEEEITAGPFKGRGSTGPRSRR